MERGIFGNTTGVVVAVAVAVVVAIAGTRLWRQASPPIHRRPPPPPSVNRDSDSDSDSDREVVPVGFLVLREKRLDLLSVTAHPVQLPLMRAQDGAYYALPDKRMGASVNARVVDARGVVQTAPTLNFERTQHLTVEASLGRCDVLRTGDVVTVPAYQHEFEVVLY